MSYWWAILWFALGTVSGAFGVLFFVWIPDLGPDEELEDFYRQQAAEAEDELTRKRRGA